MNLSAGSHRSTEASGEPTRGRIDRRRAVPVADRQSVELASVSEVGWPATPVRARVPATAAAASAQIVERGCLRGVVNSVGTGFDCGIVPPFANAGAPGSKLLQ
jgi:hypothetical protein